MGPSKIMIVRVSGTVLIAWSHENIAKIVAALGMSDAVPSEWPDERFDIVWVFDRVRQHTRFTQVPQCLLACDSGDVIASKPIASG